MGIISSFVEGGNKRAGIERIEKVARRDDLDPFPGLI